MATQVQHRRGSTAEHSSFTGAAGEITVDTTKKTAVVHDGSTAGGIPLAKESTVTALDSAAVHKTGDETVAGTKTLSSNPVLSTGTANGVAYLNGSKVLTTGSALTFDGTALTVGGNSSAKRLYINGLTGTGIRVHDDNYAYKNGDITYEAAGLTITSGDALIFGAVGSEQMRLTSTGLGIGTSSPLSKLTVQTQAAARLSVRTTDIIFGTITGGSALDSLNGSDTALAPLGVRGNGVYINDGTGTTTFSGGNLGLGVTPSAWGSGYKAIELSTRGANITGDVNFNYTYVGANNFHNGSAWTYKVNGFATRYAQGDGAHLWYTAPSGTAGNAISFTQAMTLDASGNLYLGSSTSSGNLYVGPAMISSNGGANPLIFGINATERMRIDSSGNLLVNTTSAIVSGVKFNLVGAATNSAGVVQVGTDGYAAFDFRNASSAQVGYIQVNTATTVYASVSDYRLKENIQPMQNALGVVAQLNPVTYTWKADGSDGQGFIAHELQSVVPDCVTGEKDAVDEEGKPVYQGIDTSFLVATLTKAIQELKQELDATKAEVAALKGA